MKISNLTNYRFGKLIALSKETSDKYGNMRWLCQCDCGNKIVIRGTSLRNGSTKSCGCIQKTHGMSTTRIYKVWNDMIRRCKDKKNKAYKYYGARGITVCKRWLKFESFYRDMGDRPEGLTLERVDNEKGYFPDNCEWQTQKHQNNNSRNNVFIYYKSQNLSVAQWTEKIGIKYSTLYYRLKIVHWPIEKALTQPIQCH